MVGSGSNCTATQIEKSIEYQNMGADALLLIAPYYNKANAEGMYRHFAETADKVQIPCILYNVPGRTGCSIPVSVVERLSQHPNIAGIKEASGDMSYAMKIAPLCGSGLRPLLRERRHHRTSDERGRQRRDLRVCQRDAGHVAIRLWRTSWAAIRPRRWPITSSTCS